MQSGLLWFDNSTRPLAEKLAIVAHRYQQKFGVTPDTCYVNPVDAPTDPNVILNPTAPPHDQKRIQVSAKQTIMRDYLWLGVANPQPTPVSL